MVTKVRLAHRDRTGTALPALLPNNLRQFQGPPLAEVRFEPLGVEATLQHDHLRVLSQYVRNPRERSRDGKRAFDEVGEDVPGDISEGDRVRTPIPTWWHLLVIIVKQFHCEEGGIVEKQGGVAPALLLSPRSARRGVEVHEHYLAPGSTTARDPRSGAHRRGRPESGGAQERQNQVADTLDHPASKAYASRMSDPSPLAVPIAPPATHTLAGQSFTTMLRALDTGGRYSLMHWIVPVDAEAVGHRHERYEETFLVLEGTLAIEIDGERLTAEPGMWLRAPAGAAHSYRNAGAVEARMLVTFSPGGIEALFEEFGDPVDGPGGPSRLEGSVTEYIDKARSVHGTEYGI